MTEYPHETLRRHLTVRRPCACGGIIVAPSDWATSSPLYAVARHNRTAGHRAWRERGGLG